MKYIYQGNIHSEEPKNLSKNLSELLVTRPRIEPGTSEYKSIQLRLHYASYRPLTAERTTTSGMVVYGVYATLEKIYLQALRFSLGSFHSTNLHLLPIIRGNIISESEGEAPRDSASPYSYNLKKQHL